MILFYGSLLLLILVLSAFNWFYVREVEAAKTRIGMALPRQARLFVKGVFFACLFAVVGVLFTVFISLLASL